MIIVWFVNAIGIGGGFRVILDFASSLVDLGNTVYLANMTGTDYRWRNTKATRVGIREGDALSKEADVVIASESVSAHYVSALPTSARKFYLIQGRDDIWDKTAVGAATAYTLGLNNIAISKWIGDYLTELTGKETPVVNWGFDLDIWKEKNPIALRAPDTFRILLEGNTYQTFKRVREAFDVAREVEGAEVWGCSAFGIDLPFDRGFSQVAFDTMPTIYSSCDVFIKLSECEGLACSPAEAMICGCVPVVTDIPGHVDYCEDEINSLVVDVGDYPSALEALKRLKDFNFRKTLADAGKLTSQGRFNMLERAVELHHILIA